MVKELVCRFEHYEVSGYALILDWSGNIGFIEMKRFCVKSYSDIESGLNDNGFGCQRMIACFASVYACYEYGAKKFADNIYFNMLDNTKAIERKYLDMYNRFMANMF
jgi:hypothetical protein